MKLSQEWKDIDEIIVYGLGEISDIYLDDISKDVKLRFIIENNEERRMAYSGTTEVYSFEECQELIKDTKIVVFAQTRALSQIRRNLIDRGYIENEDFTTVERFVSEWFYMKYNEARILDLHTAVSSYCTFNCKHCNMFIPYHKEKKHYSFEELKENIDLLFEYTDYVYKYQLIGGEPFLNKDLERFLYYLRDAYADRIAHIYVISNGYIIPDIELINALKACECEIWLSNYERVINYKEKYEETKRVLEQNDIMVQAKYNVRWTDYGFPVTPNNFSPEEAAIHTALCGTTFHGLEDKKLFYCNCAWSASKTGLFEPKEDDYLELSKLERNADSKKKILELCLGEFEKGYHSFCCLCGGLGEDNTTSVEAGIQI